MKIVLREIQFCIQSTFSVLYLTIIAINALDQPSQSTAKSGTVKRDGLVLTTDTISRLTEDDLLVNETSDIPIWDASDTRFDVDLSLNESIKTFIDEVENITSFISLVDASTTNETSKIPLNNERDPTKGTITRNPLAMSTTNRSFEGETTSPSTVTTAEISSTFTALTTSTSPKPLEESMVSHNESKVFYEPTLSSNESSSKPSDDSVSHQPESNPLSAPAPGEVETHQRIPCSLEGDLLCSNSVPTCFGSGRIDCGGRLMSSNRKRSTSVNSSGLQSMDTCEVIGDIMCTPLVSREHCFGQATCKTDRMEETLIAYSYWQILLIAGALAIICVTILIVAIVGYFSWTKYKVQPEGQVHSNQVAHKA